MHIFNPKAFRRKPVAVILDTDNTLYEYAPAHRKAFDRTCDKAIRILGITKEDFDKAYQKARQEVKSRLGNTASSHSRLLYFQRLIEIVGLKTQLLLTLDLNQTYWRTFLTNAQLFEGVRSFLEEVRHQGIPTAIITDLTSQVQYRKIIYFGLEEYFDFVVTSEEVGADKPNPAGLMLAREKLNVGQGEIWMIGDDPVADIQGAKEHLGAVTLQKKHSGVEIVKGEMAPDAVFESYIELTKFFARDSTRSYTGSVE